MSQGIKADSDVGGRGCSIRSFESITEIASVWQVMCAAEEQKGLGFIVHYLVLRRTLTNSHFVKTNRWPVILSEDTYPFNKKKRKKMSGISNDSSVAKSMTSMYSTGRASNYKILPLQLGVPASTDLSPGFFLRIFAAGY